MITAHALLCSLMAVQLVDGAAAPSPGGPHAENAPTAIAQSADGTDAVHAAPAATLRFADHLFLDGDWYRAITEYRRFLWLQQGRGPDAERASLAIGEALARGEQWDAAGRQLDGVAVRAADQSLRSAALYGAGRVYLLDGRPELAKPRFRLLVEEPAVDPALQAQARWLLAWGHFDAGELGRARAIFHDVAAAGGTRAADAAALVAAIDARGDLPTKNPLVAGMLSLIPGLGHFYLGQWAVGATSLVWNGLFIFAAVSSWLAGDIGVAVVLALFEFGWYGGGIFGAVAGAYRHNRDAVRNWRDELLATHGASRALPAMHEVAGAPPGTLLRFTGAF